MEYKQQFEDESLGEFFLDGDEYICELNWLGNIIEICIDKASEEHTAQALETAYMLYEDQPKWDAYFRRAASKDLLETKNSDFLKEDDWELSPDVFQNRLKLIAIMVSPNGKFEVHFDDDSMFDGRFLGVSGTIGGDVEAQLLD